SCWVPALAPVGLLAVGGALLAWSARSQRAPPESTRPDVAAAARDLLRIENVRPLSAPLEQLLVDAAAKRIRTEAHAALGRQALAVELADHQGRVWRLRDQLDRGPVVVVFYYGYHCN